jgi:hypothetical protein
MDKLEYIAKGIVKYILFLMSVNKDFRAFHHFPFNPNDPMPDGAVKVMAVCCEALEQINATHRLTDGTILGLYRQGAFIPHDNDIDIDILDFKDMDLLQASMKRLGMKLGRKAVYKKQVHQLAYYSSNHIVFDMIFWYSEGEQIVNYSEEGYKRTQPKKYFTDLDSIKYGEKTYPMPSHIEEWLVLRYGEDWRTPKTYKDDWKKECYDLDKL